MSNAPHLVPASIRNGHKMGDMSLKDHMITDGLWDSFNDYHMGITAENIAEKYNISREAQDEFSLKSQLNAIKAVDEGLFDNEIVPVEVKTRKETLIVDKDEYPNRSTNMEKIAKLRPAFKKDGTVTAANSSGINDGASGNRILVSLLHILKDKNAEYGLASLCIGGGMGTAIIVKRG